ncbi:hypothetical protein [Candidatus Agathobaculum pullicola]|uniref:hypothetical protein n=1 Tax=Candidatus Agathobaculum pullicola TaxID=2838426 RepID=UPI003F90E7A8
MSASLYELTKKFEFADMSPDKLVKAATVRSAVLMLQIDGVTFIVAQKQITGGML